MGFNNRFIQDDAFISFRYAQNFSEGNGLTWNIGDNEPVEGYTNFLWTLLIVPATALNLDPVLWSMILGFVFGSGTLFFTYYVSLRIVKSRLAALLSVLFLGTNYTFSSYITGGLETQFQTFLIIAGIYYSFFLSDRSFNMKPSWVWFLLLSVLFSFAVMTRLDSVLICGVLLVFVINNLYHSQAGINEKISKLTSLIVPGVLIVGAWILFKLSYYGDILPNTFYVKAMGGLSLLSLLRGLYYVFSFFINYGLILFVLLGVRYFHEIFSKSSPANILFVIICIWTLYVIKVSGDFMEYRFFVPIMPPIYILISSLILLMKNWKVQIIAGLFLLCCSSLHAITFEISHGIESISELNGHIMDEEQNWGKVGRTLGELFFDAEHPVKISTTAAGAIPYYSKLPTVDMLGLNDKWIAKNGITIGSRPGHARYTTMQYLIDSKVNLVLGHPQVKPKSFASIDSPESFFWAPLDFSLLPITSKIIEIPLDDNYRIDVLYIFRHSVVDNIIEQLDLVTHDIS